MEYNFDNFTEQYNLFELNKDLLREKIIHNLGNNLELNRLERISDQLLNLDVKLRLAFGIDEIILNNNFVSEKQGDLKLCHLLYYKLADLWFAYETYINFYTQIVGTTKYKIVWLDSTAHSLYTLSPEIINSLRLVNEKFTELYSIGHTRNMLIDYLNFSLAHSKNGQSNRLTNIITRIQNNQFNLSNSDVLTIIYAIRNNFVHNGETTVVPNIFGYQNKVELLSCLYPYLSIVILKSINISFERI